MIEPRLYRAAFLPALLAAVIAAFSLEDRPPAVPQGLPADVLFDGGLASSSVGEIVHAAPDRRVGSPGDLRTAGTVAGAFRGFRFTTTVDRFRDAAPGCRRTRSCCSPRATRCRCPTRPVAERTRRR